MNEVPGRKIMDQRHGQLTGNQKFQQELMMTEHNKKETAKLARGAKWVIRQLLLEIETRETEIELYDAVPDGFVIFYRLLSGHEAVVAEFAERLNIQKQGNRLEVAHA